jgi:hypothetical protein
VNIYVQARAVVVNGANGPSQGWADAAESLWSDLYRRLEMAYSKAGSA